MKQPCHDCRRSTPDVTLQEVPSTLELDDPDQNSDGPTHELTWLCGDCTLERAGA
ncbi:hypothetical protein [Streptomyces lydicus]|uniref:hypothetical protein n=1 Tax=Streptomyces lydicus TaxID=47763 RepID=UPI0036E3273E